MSKAPYVPHQQSRPGTSSGNADPGVGQSLTGENPSEPPRRVFTEHGREYGCYDYMFPCDQVWLTSPSTHPYKIYLSANQCPQLEEDKLDIFHHAILEAQQKRLYRAPVYFRHRSELVPSSKDKETKQPLRRAGRQILDLGTGTGLWAMSMAE